MTILTSNNKSLKVSEGGKNFLHFGGESVKKVEGDNISKSGGWNKKERKQDFFEKIGGGTYLQSWTKYLVQIREIR